MKNKTIKISGYLFVFISSLSLIYVSALAWIDPKDIMALVQVKLENTDALSSIRGVYGGVGFTLAGLVILMSINNLQNGLLFLSVFWLMYAISRVLTIIIDGPLGDFGNMWIKIESMFAVIAFILYLLNRPGNKSAVRLKTGSF